MVDPNTTTRIFIIDDDLYVLASTTRLLQSHGFEVAGFHSAESFLTLREDDWSGCVVTDLKMEGMNGLELQRTIQANGWNFDVIIVTGDVDVGTTVEIMGSGAITLLEKPFPAPQLLEAIRRSSHCQL